MSEKCEAVDKDGNVIVTSITAAELDKEKEKKDKKPK